MKERLHAIAEKAGVPMNGRKKRLAKALGVSPRTIESYMLGSRTPSNAVEKLIVQAEQYGLDFLLNDQRGEII